MARNYVFPSGALVDDEGNPTVAGRAYLQAIQDLTQAINDVENIDVTATTAEVRDKLLELISVLQG
jgi:hypothetical protein